MADPKPRWSAPPTLEEIETIALAALNGLPKRFLRHVGDVVVRVEEFPDEETEELMELETPFDILGLYRGVALPHLVRHVMIHEIGHHFGFSDADMTAIENDAAD